MTAPEDALTGDALTAWRIYNPQPVRRLAYLGKSALLGIAGAGAVTVLVILDAAWKDRKLRKAALLHDGTYPAWRAAL